METAKKKQRPYSEYERQLLIQLVQSKIGIVENRRTDGVSQRKKLEAWDEITHEFNNSNIVTQTADTKQLKKMWQNLKTRARDAKTLEAQRKRTGGGPAPPDVGPLEAQVIAIMPNVLPSIDVEIDSDTSAVAGTTLGLDSDEQSWLPKRARVSDVEQIEFEYVNEPGKIQETSQKPIEEQEQISIQEQTSDSMGAIVSSNNNNVSKSKKKKSFDELKQDLLMQELENNKKRYEEEMRQCEAKYIQEKEFLTKKQALELEILENKKKCDEERNEAQKKKSEEEMRRDEERYIQEMDFIKKKQALELEILEIRKKKLGNKTMIEIYTFCFIMFFLNYFYILSYNFMQLDISR